MRRAVICVLLLSAVVYGQASPTFEVASVRPSSPQTNDVRAGVRIAGAQVRFVSMSIKDFIGTAYGVKPQQISRSAINAGVTLPPQALRLLDNANTDPLSGPLRDVGLTLESRKAPLKVVVVDAISRTPTKTNSVSHASCRTWASGTDASASGTDASPSAQGPLSLSSF